MIRNSISTVTHLATTIPKSSTSSTQVLRSNQPSSRSMASFHGGKYRSGKNPIKGALTASETTPPIETDTSGFHANVVMRLCNNKSCKDYNCATKDPITPPCNDVRTNLKKEDICEYIGALTHSLPTNANGGIVYYKDSKNENKPQYVMTEKGVIPTKADDFKEKLETSEYLQQYPHTGNIINYVSQESIINQTKDSLNTKSKILSRTPKEINGIPTDVGF